MLIAGMKVKYRQTGLQLPLVLYIIALEMKRKQQHQDTQFNFRTQKKVSLKEGYDIFTKASMNQMLQTQLEVTDMITYALKYLDLFSNGYVFYSTNCLNLFKIMNENQSCCWQNLFLFCLSPMQTLRDIFLLGTESEQTAEICYYSNDQGVL